MNKGPENICLIYDYIFIRVSHFFKLHGSNGSLGIAPTFLKLDLWSPGTGFYSDNIHQGNKSDKLNRKMF